MEALETFEDGLAKYARLIVEVGLNVQPGQPMMIADSGVRFGLPRETEPMIQLLAQAARQVGGGPVEPIWGDAGSILQDLKTNGVRWVESMSTGRFQNVSDHVSRGGTHLWVHAYDPRLMDNLNHDVVSAFERKILELTEVVRESTTRNQTNWCVIAAPVAGWADRVFPELAPENRLPRLWESIFRVCRVDRPDPAAAWQEHAETLHARSHYLNGKGYSALHYRAPGTDLTLGLAEGHIWHGGGDVTTSGVAFVPNLPTEEIYTLPDRTRAEGIVTASMPLSVGGRLIEGIQVVFHDGKVVEAHAASNEADLKALLAMDEGATHLGEAALVPHSSPIAQSGILFYDTLLDENAACHLALGRGYSSTLRGSDAMDDDSFQAAGGNLSLIHVDFMIGRPDMDIDGVTRDGVYEPVFRAGNWAFDL